MKWTVSGLRFTDRIIFIIILILSLSYLVHFGKGVFVWNETDFFNVKERNTFNAYFNQQGAIKTQSTYDSLNNVVSIRKADYNGGLGWSLILFNISFEEKYPDGERSSGINYFFGLKHVHLRSSCDVYFENGRYLITKSEKDTLSMPVRYDFNNQRLLLPLPAAAAVLTKVVFYAFMIIYVLIFLISFFSLPIAVLSNISRGHVFKEKNIVTLGFMTRSILLSTAGLLILNLLTAIVCYGRLKGYFYFDWGAMLASYRGYFIAGLVILLLYRAFKQGYDLEKENELTI